MFDPKKKLTVAFLWHMHQPFYKDTVSGEYLMPWVRLHGVKDYYPMAALVENFTDIKATFNLVPSLVEQIDDYARNDASDAFLDLTIKKADSLSLEDRCAIIKDFFHVNFKQFIEPSSRYLELYIKRGDRPLTPRALKDAAGRLKDQDYLDLQVLFNLAWFHSITIDEDVNLKDIVAKRESFTEEDKGYIVERQREILRQIIPLYRKLSDEGRIEITTTPYYHPIMPLLCDTEIAAISLPGRELPHRRFRHPEDTAWQIEAAMRYHAAQFGQAPAGMWPSEGSVSDETLEIAMSKGIRWMATDEDILFRSLSSYDRKYHGVTDFDRRIIYRPYKYTKARKDMSVIFRDKNISDIVSFNYHEWDQDEAAWDLIGHCKRVAENLRRDTDRGLLTIAMDGENAWEFFRDNGRRFFEVLYANLDKEEDVCSATVSDFLAVEPPKRNISNIFPGSWINHNFDIWIGQEQDNISWDYLDTVRRDLVKFTKEFDRSSGSDRSKLEAAWKEFYISEGSDWNWWYEGKSGSGSKNPFDKVYRAHLKNVYKLLKKPVPEFLKVSINEKRKV